MLIDQISVFVENKPGRLSYILGKLAEANIDIRALSLADTTNFGILRMIVSDPVLAESSLKGSGLTVSRNEVIAVALNDRPGSLHDVLARLFDGGISVEYAYAFLTRESTDAFVILRVEDSAQAIAILEKNNFRMLSPQEAYTL